MLPKEMDAGDIRENLDAWRVAALRSLDAGYEICEIHAAHGYLISQFLSPLANRRSDEWGGSLANRARLLIEVVRAVREIGRAHV